MRVEKQGKTERGCAEMQHLSRGFPGRLPLRVLPAAHEADVTYPVGKEPLYERTKEAMQGMPLVLHNTPYASLLPIH